MIIARYLQLSLFFSDGDDEHKFTIGRDTGSIMIAGRLDAEQKSLYNLTVSVTDGVHSATTQVMQCIITWTAGVSWIKIMS